MLTYAACCIGIELASHAAPGDENAASAAAVDVAAAKEYQQGAGFEQHKLGRTEWVSPEFTSMPSFTTQLYGTHMYNCDATMIPSPPITIAHKTRSAVNR